MRRSQPETDPAVVSTPVDRWEDGGWRADRDRLAVEEPCEIRLQGEAVAVVMRTPGDDGELAAGFLFTESIVDADDIGTITHCLEASADERPEGATTVAAATDGDGGPGPVDRSAGSRESVEERNVVEVRLQPGREPRRGWQRNFFAVSSCGVCGKASIDAVHVDADPVAAGPAVRATTLQQAVASMERRQPVFGETGGLHAAAVFRDDGRHLVSREDVGRHNAVDKVLGFALLTEALPLDRHFLVVSGRASFEILQKALRARIPVVAAVSAASSLAVDFARESGMTLVGFVRDGRMVIYSGRQRIDDRIER